MPKTLIVENLVKRYKGVTAVDGISFAIDKGQIFGLVGPNGAGKSTTLKIVATVLSPTQGRVEICGHNMEKDAKTIRSLISYLPEEAGAYKNLSGLGYLKFMAAIFSDNPSQQTNYLESAKRIAGLGERLKDKVSTYSKGMARKLLIARAMMVKPQLAILDEPTSGLDVINAFEVRNIIKSLAQDGMSVLLSSHNMLEVEFLSEQIAIIHQGKILATDTPENLKEQFSAKNLEEVFVKITQ